MWQTDFVLALVTIFISGPGGQYGTNVKATSSHDALRKGVKLLWRSLKVSERTN